MSDLAPYEALASTMLRRCGKSEERLRRVETHLLLERDRAATPECREGFDLVLKRVRERLATWPEARSTATRSCCVSVHRLQLEQELRAEEARAREVRAELARPIATVPQRHRVPHRTPKVLVLAARDGRSLCAAYLLDWWQKRNRFTGPVRPVSTNEINRLAAILRRLE